MLKNIHYLFIVCGMLLAASCMKDLGNYDYKDINEVEISGIKDRYDVLAGEHLVIKPELNFTKDKGNDAGRYRYEWYAADYDRVDLATTRDLDVPVRLQPGVHEIFYRVTDTVTGVQWARSFSLSVQTSVYEGWLVLCDDNGTARLDMISLIKDKFTPIHDVLAYTGSHLKLEGAPVDIATASYLATPNVHIYISAKGTGTTNINAETFDWTPQDYLAYETLMSVPDNFMADFIQPNGATFSSYMYKDGDVYYYNGIFGARYSLPINIMSGETDKFEAAPFIASGHDQLASIMSGAVLYDMTHKRFVRQGVTASSCSEMPAGFLFDYHTGMDLVYMVENTYNNGQIFAILKDPAGSYHLARMSAMFGSYMQTYWSDMPATDIGLAEHFAVSPEFGYIFYNVGSKIYEYDMSLKQSKLMLDMGEKKISLLAFHLFFYTYKATYSTLSKKLIVGVYDPSGPAGSNGTLELYTVPPVNQDLVLYESYSGFGKIVDVDYRER